jgi:hypothetical protein
VRKIRPSIILEAHEIRSQVRRKAIESLVAGAELVREHGYSVRLGREPTLAQATAILRSVETALREIGAEVSYSSPSELKFHMPSPLKTGKLNPLLAVTGGDVVVSAGGGSGRRIRYTLSFLRLRVFTVAMVVLTVAIGFRWPRVTLVGALVLVWVLVFVLPWRVASRRFRRVVRRAAEAQTGAGTSVVT